MAAFVFLNEVSGLFGAWLPRNRSDSCSGTAAFHISLRPSWFCSASLQEPGGRPWCGRWATGVFWQLCNRQKSHCCQDPTELELTLRWILQTIQADLSFWKVFRVKKKKTIKCFQFAVPPCESCCLQPPHAPQHWVIIPSGFWKPKIDGKQKKHDLELLAWDQNWPIHVAGLEVSALRKGGGWENIAGSKKLLGQHASFLSQKKNHVDQGLLHSRC